MKGNIAARAEIRQEKKSLLVGMGLFERRVVGERGDKVIWK